MKSRALICIAAMTLFAALLTPAQLGAQGQATHFRHYKLIDIGTFGGPYSYINQYFTFGSHNQINQPGTIVGSAATSNPTSPTSDFFVCGGLDGAVPCQSRIQMARRWPDRLGCNPGRQQLQRRNLHQCEWPDCWLIGERCNRSGAGPKHVSCRPME